MDKVGMMHAQPTTRRGLHVEYVHLGTTIGFIQDILTEDILTHPRLKLERKIAMVKAIGKVLWIQNDLFARWHVKDGEGLKRSVLTPNSEKDGFLMMFKLDDSIGSSTEEGFSSPAPSDVGTPAEELKQCPFTGLANHMGNLDLRS
jgi:hypothetical protein